LYASKGALSALRLQFRYTVDYADECLVESTLTELPISLWVCQFADSYVKLNVESLNVTLGSIQRFAQKHEERLHHHANVEAIQLLDNVDIVRRLQRKKPFELI
jgi:hypothetical protein